MYLEITGSILALGISFYFIFLILNKKQKDSVKDEIVELLKQYGSVNIEGKNIEFTTKNKTYRVLFYYVSPNLELTINSKTKWEIRSKTKSLVVDKQHFLSSKLPKLVIIYPTTHPIKRYINENEMVFVKPQEHFYQMNIMLKSDLKNILSEDIL